MVLRSSDGRSGCYVKFSGVDGNASMHGEGRDGQTGQDGKDSVRKRKRLHKKDYPRYSSSLEPV